jgi:GH35 family endo-1,4-beta-xylanase
MRRALCILVALVLSAAFARSAAALPAADIAGAAIHPWRLTDPEVREQTFAGLAAAGVRWARVDFRWLLVEPRRRANRVPMDWSEPDALVAAAARHGVTLLPIVEGVPPWANGGGGPWAYPTDTAAFEEFFQAALERYPQIPAWEIWNEPNFLRFSEGGPDVARFVELLRSAHRARERAGSSAKLISGGLAPGTDIDVFPWVQEMARLGGLELIDGLGVHPYSASTPESLGSWFMRLEWIHALLGALGKPNLPLWVTEYGAPVSTSASGYGNPLDEEEQARRLRMAFALATRWPWIENLTWYEFRDSCGESADPECRFGLVREDFSPRPAYQALREVVSGAIPRLSSRLEMRPRLQRTVSSRARAARLWHTRQPWIVVEGKLFLLGSSPAQAGVAIQVRARGKRPRTLLAPVRDGVFRARVGRRGSRSVTIEALYPGSDAHEPAVSQSMVVRGAVRERTSTRHRTRLPRRRK